MEKSKYYTINKEKFDSKKSDFSGLMSLLGKQKWIYLGAIVLFAIAMLQRTLTSILVGYFVDDILTRDDFVRWLPWVAGGFVLTAVIRGITSFYGTRLSSRTAETIAQNLRNYAFDHIQMLSLKTHSKWQVGELIQRVTSDIDMIRLFFSDRGMEFGRIMFLFIFNFVGILMINTKLALLSVMILPLTVGLSFWFARKIRDLREEYQELDALVTTTLQENLSGMRVVKAFARQDFEKIKLKKDNWSKFLKGKRMMLVIAFYWPFSDIFCFLQLILSYYIGARMAIDGVISAGDYLAFVGMVVMAIWPIRNLGRLVVDSTKALVSYHRVQEVVLLDREDLFETALEDESVDGKIVFDHVSFDYETQDHALKDISFEVNPGDTIAILGGTGSGKSTLVNLLPRFYDVTSGKITINGQDIQDFSKNFLRKNIGIVEQEPFLFSRSIRENIEYGLDREVDIEEVYAAAKIAAVHDVIESFPDGYDTLVGEKGVTLSGGQKQRVAIARAVLKNPKILILDDATSSVDLETEEAISDALDGVMENRTTFIVAHRVQSVKNADLILVMEEGEIVQKGTHETLVNQPGRYQKVNLIQSQIDKALIDEINQAVVVED